jgi:hypothetical protein
MYKNKNISNMERVKGGLGESLHPHFTTGILIVKALKFAWFKASNRKSGWNRTF